MNELDTLFAQVFGTPVASDPIADYVAHLSQMLAALLIAGHLPVISVTTKHGKMDLMLVDMIATNGKIVFRFADPTAKPVCGQFSGYFFRGDDILHTSSTKDTESAIARRLLKATQKAYEQYC